MPRYKDNPFYGKIRYRIGPEKQQDCYILTIGEHGVGKTYTAMEIAWRLDWHKLGLSPEELTRQRVIFNPKRFLEIHANHEFPPMSAMVFEEPGVSFAARRWYSKLNMALDATAQVSRRWRYVVIFALRNVGLLDSHIREGRFKYEIEVKGIDFEKKQTTCHIKRCQYNPTIPKVYRKTLRDSEGMIDPFCFNMIPKDLAKAYEKISDYEKTNIIKEQLANLEDMEPAKKVSDDDIIKEIMEDIKKNGNDSMFLRKGKINAIQIEANYNVSNNAARRIRVKITNQLTL